MFIKEKDAEAFQGQKKDADGPRPLLSGASRPGGRGPGEESPPGPVLPGFPRQAEPDLVRHCSHGASPLLVLTLPTQIKHNAAPSGVLVSEKRVMAQMGLRQPGTAPPQVSSGGGHLDHRAS